MSDSSSQEPPATDNSTNIPSTFESPQTSEVSVDNEATPPSTTTTNQPTSTLPPAASPSPNPPHSPTPIKRKPVSLAEKNMHAVRGSDDSVLMFAYLAGLNGIRVERDQSGTDDTATDGVEEMESDVESEEDEMESRGRRRGRDW